MDTVLNWLVQGVIVAVAAAAGLRVIPASRPQARYGFLWAACLAVLALPAVPAALAVVPIDVSPGNAAPGAAGAVATLPSAWWTSGAAAFGLWIVWSGIHAVRIVVTALAVRNARRNARACPPDVLARLPRWSELHDTGRRTRVVLTDRVHAAAVLGCGAPVVALTPTLLERLGAADLDRVLIHEWAHVQRHDDVARVVQQFVRMAVGWHPAAWWLDRQLDFEREAACDQVAVRVTGSVKGYAACLATLASMPVAPIRPLPALAALAPSRLRRRVRRILLIPGIRAAQPWRGVAISGGALLIACSLAAANVEVVASALPPRGVPMPARLVIPPGNATQRVAAARPELRIASTRPLGTARAPRRNGTATRTRRETATIPPAAFAPPVVDERSATAAAPSPQPAADPLIDARIHASPATIATADSVERPGEKLPSLPAVSGEPAPAGKERSDWMRAADAGVAIGRASRGAGVATAGFFTRLGKKLAGSF